MFKNVKLVCDNIIDPYSTCASGSTKITGGADPYRENPAVSLKLVGITGDDCAKYMGSGGYKEIVIVTAGVPDQYPPCWNLTYPEAPLQFSQALPKAEGPWTVTWSLVSPRGDVAARASITLVVPRCRSAASSCASWWQPAPLEPKLL